MPYAKLDSTYPAVAESWAVPDKPYLEIAREETNIANARMLRLLPLLTAEITAVLVVIQMYAVAEKHSVFYEILDSDCDLIWICDTIHGSRICDTIHASPRLKFSVFGLRRTTFPAACSSRSMAKPLVNSPCHTWRKLTSNKVGPASTRSGA